MHDNDSNHKGGRRPARWCVSAQVLSPWRAGSVVTLGSMFIMVTVGYVLRAKIQTSMLWWARNNTINRKYAYDDIKLKKTNIHVFLLAPHNVSHLHAYWNEEAQRNIDHLPNNCKSRCICKAKHSAQVFHCKHGWKWSRRPHNRTLFARSQGLRAKDFVVFSGTQEVWMYVFFLPYCSRKFQVWNGMVRFYPASCRVNHQWKSR